MVPRHALLLLSAPWFIPASMAQRNLEVGLSSGLVHYYGDLGNFDGPVQWNSARPGMQIAVRDFLNNPKRYVTRSLTTEVRLSWLRAGYDETAMVRGMDVRQLRNYRRGLCFRNDLVGISGHLVLNAYREPYQPLFYQRFFMYFHTGVGVYHGRPKADLFRGGPDPANKYYFWGDGTVRDMPRDTPPELTSIIEKDGTYETDLYSWLTESNGTAESASVNPRSPWHVAVPLGFGLRYMLNKKVSVGMEFSYYMFTNDRIDDVSDRYATWQEIQNAYPNDPVKQELARYVSDPTQWGSDGTESTRTSARGNPGLLDTISFLNFEVSYKFKRRPNQRTAHM